MAATTPVNPGLDDPRMSGAFPTLSDEDIASLKEIGKEVHLNAGEFVWHAGQVDLCMYVVIEGEMRIEDGRTGKYITSHKKGAFSGDIDIISGRSSIVSGLAGTDLDLLEVPADCVRTIVSEQPHLGEILLKAFLLRRSLLIDTTVAGPMVVGSRYSPETLRIREFLRQNRYPVVWEDLEANPDISRMLQEFEIPEDQTPVVVLPDGRILRTPSNSDLAEALGIKRPVEIKAYDLVIIGAGPAGLAAAVYGASEGLGTLLVDTTGPGGQAGTSSRIENYMGFPLGISGQELADSALIQAEKFGARMIAPGEATAISCNHIGGHEVEIEGLGTIDCKCVILAPGAGYRKLEVEDLERFEGRGVYYAATHIERLLCGSDDMVVVGGGNSAGQAAVFMSENAGHVFLVVRADDLRKGMSSYLAKRIESSDNITVLLNSEVRELRGDVQLEEVMIVNKSTLEHRTEKVAGVFVMIGAVPRTDWLPKEISTDQKGFILTGNQLSQRGIWTQSRPPFFLETSCPGVFAVGDARSNSVKRVASAVGEGSMAVALVHQFLSL